MQKVTDYNFQLVNNHYGKPIKEKISELSDYFEYSRA